LGEDAFGDLPCRFTVVYPSESVIELIIVAVSFASIDVESFASSFSAWRLACFSSEWAISYRVSRVNRVPPACCTLMVADVINATLSALKRLIFEPRTDPVADDFNRDRKSSWYFVTVATNSAVAEAIAAFVLVRSIGNGGHAAALAKVWGGC
jgi:hypothetical protein